MTAIMSRSSLECSDPDGRNQPDPRGQPPLGAIDDSMANTRLAERPCDLPNVGRQVHHEGLSEPVPGEAVQRLTLGAVTLSAADSSSWRGGSEAMPQTGRFSPLFFTGSILAKPSSYEISLYDPPMSLAASSK